jgi:hypothetical protein
MFDELTQDLLDLRASLQGEQAAHYAAFLDCCCCCSCGCLFICSY